MNLGGIGMGQALTFLFLAGLTLALLLWMSRDE